MMEKNRRKIMLEEEIDGASYVYVPKDLWDRMWEILDRLEELGNRYDKYSVITNKGYNNTYHQQKEHR